MKSVSVFFAASLLALSAQAAGNSPAPDLDLTIQYYSKVVTPEGVMREARYEEKMLRRPGHVWVMRVLPKNVDEQHDDESHASHQPGKKNVALQVNAVEHKHFNHVVTPRHVVLENNKLRVEYIDAHGKNLIAIPPSEYDNVNFDGSWENTFYLLDPKLVNAMPVSKRTSAVAGAKWHEREKNGVFQRVLWDEQKQIPLTIESGDKAATFYRRVDVKLQASASRALPWTSLKGYAQKEYADFLD